MKKLIIVFLAAILCLAYTPSLSQARGFGGSHSFGTHRVNTFKSPTNIRTPRASLSRGSSLMSHAASFGMGMLIGHMFHPFGGYYGGGNYGFSFFGILLDVIAILLIIRLIKGIFGRRRY